MQVGTGVWKDLPRHIPEGTAAAVLVSDEVVDGLYGEKVASILADRLPVVRLSFPAGEESKARTEKAALEDAMLARGLGRDTVVTALGGGVTMDLAGYVAATYMRGIPSILLPTSLLAMVDASIGGKTGINTPAGKNLIGAFHHPLAILADVACLATLSRDETLNGLAEIAKAGVIGDRTLFADLAEKGIDGMADSIEGARCVARAADVKIEVVNQDPSERGLRQVLNFGHTFGHALERAAGYRLPHGLAVAAGMRLETRLALRMGVLNPDDGKAIEQGLDAMGFPFSPYPGLDCAAVMDHMRRDKKNKAGTLRFSLPEALGRMTAGPEGTYSVPVEPSHAEAVLGEAGL